MKFLPPKQLLPTCQSPGKMYLRLEQFENALKYQDTPISGISMVNLLSKLSSLKRFSELSLTGIRVNKAMVDGICKFASSYILSGLLLGRTYIGMDGALRLTAALGSGPQELVKLDLSYCCLSSHDFPKFCANISLIGGLLELNLGENSIGQEACDPLRTILMGQQCCVKSLILNNCQLGPFGIVQIIQALSGNESLEELRLAENAHMAQDRTLEYESASLRCSGTRWTFLIVTMRRPLRRSPLG